MFWSFVFAGLYFGDFDHSLCRQVSGQGVRCPREAAGSTLGVSLPARGLVISRGSASPINVFFLSPDEKNPDIFNHIAPTKCFAYFIILFNELA